jgi:hypothetical protein
VRCHTSIETIRAVPLGNNRDWHNFARTLSLELYNTYQAKMSDCDRKRKVAVAALTIERSDNTWCLLPPDVITELERPSRFRTEIGLNEHLEWHKTATRPSPVAAPYPTNQRKSYAVLA